jgi:hypothetical protein
MVTRFPGGVNTTTDGGIFCDFPMPDPTTFHLYYDDFDVYTAGDWTVTETQAGATQALGAGDGGLVLLTNSAADNDVNQLQKLPAAFTVTAGKKAFFACKFKLSDAGTAGALQSDCMVGLANADTAGLLTNAWVDGIYFYKADGALTIDVFVRKDATTGSNTVAAIGSVVEATFITLSWFYDGVSLVYYAIDGVIKGSLSAAAAYLPNAVTTTTLSLGNGEAVAKIMTIDYVFVALER